MATSSVPNPFRDFANALRRINSDADLPLIDQDVTPVIHWQYQPPTIDEFVTSPDYMGLPPLSQRQRKVIIEFLGDGEELLTSRVAEHEMILLWGKGGGKDYFCSIVVAYVAYTLLCLADPGSYLNMAPGEPIDIVNVATRAEQARDVFYAKLRVRLEKPCFAKFVPRILATRVEFNGKAVRIHSLHSQAQKWEGFNIFCWLMDEADAFQAPNSDLNNAADIHGVLRSSAMTRFPHRRWLGLIISYPRSELGWMMTYARQMRRTKGAYVDVATTWEVNPHYDPKHPDYQRFPMVRVHDTYDVPEPYRQEFELYPEESAMKYMCIPRSVQGAFFDWPDMIPLCVDPNKEEVLVYQHTESLRSIPKPVNHHLFGRFADLLPAAFQPGGGEEESDFVDQMYVAIQILRERHGPEPYPYYIHGDPGEVQDSFALVMGHTLPQTEELLIPTGDREKPLVLNRVVTDLVLEWKPRHNTPVDILNVRDVIMFLCRLFHVRRVTFDKFQSTQVIQELQQARIPAKSLGFSNPQQLAMFQALKSAVYHQTITWSAEANELIEPQLRYLKRKGDKVTHDEQRKDVADALAAMHWMASGAFMGKTGRAVLETVYGTPARSQARVVRRRIGR